MRPLVSPVVEYRLLGLAALLGGLALGLVALAIEDPVAALAGLLLTGAFFAGWMYLLAYRRFARAAVQERPGPTTSEREPEARTRGRVALTTAPVLVLMAAFGLLFDTPAIFGGILAGNGAALLLTSRWLRNWEQEHRSRVLREPRWRWRSEGGRSWAQGSGIMAPQDFYVVASTEPAA